MTQKTSRKELLKDDMVVESSVEIVDWLEKHKPQIVRGAAAFAALVVIVAAWTWWSGSQRREAQRRFDEGMRLLRPQAAQGAPVEPKPAEALAAFETAASKGGDSAIGRAARYYHAVCLLELGRGADAVPLLESVVGAARTGALADSARAMLAKAYEASGAVDKAESLLREIAASTDGTFPPDVALLRVGQLLQRQGKTDEARRTFQEVVTRFPQGSGAAEARASLTALSQ
ncbi:MAG TPA: tetratricopeptide repeat protein [Candidatus Polarisedimenticolaceae bacterium]